MKQKFLSRHSDGQHFPVMKKGTLPKFPSGRLKKLQPSEKDIAKEMMEHPDLVAKYGKQVAVQIARDHVRDAIAKKMMSEPITNVKYRPASGPYTGEISLNFDGQRITNKIEVVAHEPWVGAWDKDKQVVYIQKDMPEKFRKHLALHESVEKYLHDDYGLSDMAEGHEAAEEIERKWFIQNVGTEDEWKHDYTPIVEKIHREELERIGVPMHHEPLPAGGKIPRLGQPKPSAKGFASDLFMLTKTMTPEAVERVNKLLPPVGSKKETVRKWLLKKGIPFKDEKDKFAVGDADLWFVDGKYDGFGVKVRKPFGALVGKFDEG